MHSSHPANPIPLLDPRDLRITVTTLRLLAHLLEVNAPYRRHDIGVLLEAASGAEAARKALQVEIAAQLPLT